MKTRLLRILPLLLSVLLLPSCGSRASPPTAQTEESEADASVSVALLPETEDLGWAYLDRLVFFGESTTYHLKSRGVLSGGVETTQVWGPDNGTVCLDGTTASLRIRYPETGEYLTVAEAAAKKRPDYLVLTFGLNGAVQNVRRGEEYYKSCYRRLLDSLRRASPNTGILLQSCFPVAANMDMSRYTVTVDELNGLIDTLNGWTLELAEEYGLGYLDTAEILKDSAGRLKQDYQSGDGHHLTAEAYVEILSYIRTHGPREERT